MTATEILRGSLKGLGPGAEAALYSIYQDLKFRRVFLLKAGGTVALLAPVPKGAMEFHLLTVDNPTGLFRALVEIKKQLKTSGVKTIYVPNLNNNKILPFAQKAGYKTEQSDNPKYKLMVRI